MQIEISPNVYRTDWNVPYTLCFVLFMQGGTILHIEIRPIARSKKFVDNLHQL